LAGENFAQAINHGPGAGRIIADSEERCGKRHAVFGRKPTSVPWTFLPGKALQEIFPRRRTAGPEMEE